MFIVKFYLICIMVGIATCNGLGGSGIKSRWGRDFPHPSRPALGPTQPHTMGTGSFPGVKRLGRGVPIVQGGWVDPRAGADWCKISCPSPGFVNPCRPARSEPLYRLSYPDSPTNNGVINKLMNWGRCERKLL